MSISPPQDAMRKTAAETRECASSRQRSEERFRELMQVHPIDEDEEKEKADGMETAMVAPPLVFSTSSANPSIAIKPALTPELEVLFEKIASCMLVMTSAKEIETTFVIDKPGSLFFGTQITVREFSTAPKAFNVEIASAAQALHAIELHKHALVSAFEQGHFNFSVHRLDTSLQSEDRPVLHRKEHSDQEHNGGDEE